MSFSWLNLITQPSDGCKSIETKNEKTKGGCRWMTLAVAAVELHYSHLPSRANVRHQALCTHAQARRSHTTMKHRRGRTRAGHSLRTQPSLFQQVAHAQGPPSPGWDLRTALKSEARPTQPSSFLLAIRRRQSSRLASQVSPPPPDPSPLTLHRDLPPKPRSRACRTNRMQLKFYLN